MGFLRYKINLATVGMQSFQVVGEYFSGEACLPRNSPLHIESQSVLLAYILTTLFVNSLIYNTQGYGLYYSSIQILFHVAIPIFRTGNNNTQLSGCLFLGILNSHNKSIFLLLISLCVLDLTTNLLGSN